MFPSRQIERDIQLLRTRHGRKKSDLCLCEGLRACRELQHRAPERIVTGVYRSDFVNDEIDCATFACADHAWFEKFAPTENSQGILMLAKRPESNSEAKVSDPFVLALDQVNDPGNLGTIMRSLSAAGLHELWLTKGTADPFSDKAIRAGMGMQFALRIRYFEDLEAMLTAAPQMGVTGKMWLTTPHQGPSLYDVPELYEKTLIVMGGEANGIMKPPPNPHWVSLPMPGNEESLNVAQCATLFIFEYVRRLTTA